MKISFLDIWGLSSDNYENQILINVLKGDLPEGYSLVDRKAFDTTNYTDKNFDTEVHGVLFFVPWTIRDDKPLLERVKINFQMCTRHWNMNPYLLITRKDEIPEGEEEGVLKSICKALNVPENTSILVENYTNQIDKSMEIDLTSLSILDSMIRNCIFWRKPDIMPNPEPIETPKPTPNKTKPQITKVNNGTKQTNNTKITINSDPNITELTNFLKSVGINDDGIKLFIDKEIKSKDELEFLEETDCQSLGISKPKLRQIKSKLSKKE